MKHPKIVIDTNVLVSALNSNIGASFKVLMEIGSGLYDSAVSVPLVLEYEDVTKRLGRKLKISKEAAENIIDYICLVSEKTRIFYLWRPYLKDPKDDMVLELAVSAQCSHIITYNVKDFKGTDKFGIAVMTPKEFLKQLGEI